MTDDNSFKYLDIDLMEKMCHKYAVAIFDTKEDPIAHFYEHTHLLDSALNLPRQTFGGKDLYPTIVDKAAILYYTLNKNHPFKNGNKRIATISLMVFLFINDMWLDAGINEIVNKTLVIAKSDMKDKDKILEDVKKWIQEHVIPLPEALSRIKHNENKS